MSNQDSIDKIQVYIESLDDNLPKPHVITIRLSSHDLNLIEKLQKKYGIDRSKAIRLLVRLIGEQLVKGEVVNTRETMENNNVEVINNNETLLIVIPKKYISKKISIVFK